MMIVVTYDVGTTDNPGRARLRKVAKLCEAHGRRVQNSVFECILDAGQFVTLKKKLLDAADLKHDSLRFYRMGNQYKDKVEQYGAKQVNDLEGVLLI